MSATGDRRMALVDALLARHGRTFADQLGLKLERNTPAMLFQLLCAALMFSARIRADAAIEAHRALQKAALTTPEKMAAAGWEKRTRLLNQHGYARYDEKTSRMLGEAAERVIQEYKGDLRRLREAAQHDPQRERKQLQAFKGIGDVGADIFCREIQLVWDELYPFADDRALSGARRLGLPDEPAGLAELVKRDEFPRLVDALVRMELAKDHQAVMAAARGH